MSGSYSSANPHTFQPSQNCYLGVPEVPEIFDPNRNRNRNRDRNRNPNPNPNPNPNRHPSPNPNPNPRWSNPNPNPTLTRCRRSSHCSPVAGSTPPAARMGGLWLGLGVRIRG